MDSCPIPSNARENDLKTMAKERFNKKRIPRGNPDARLGVISHFSGGGSEKIRYFWGYRNHIISDADQELPVWERTKPANIKENRFAISLIQQIASLIR